MKRGKLIPKRRFKEYINDEAWERRKLSDVAKYRNGKAHENDISERGNYIVINSKFVSTDGKVRKFSDRQIEPLYQNEIAFVLSDVPNGRAIARTFLVDKHHKYTLNQRIAGITPLENVSPYFLHILMNRNRYFLQFDDGAKQTNLSVIDVMEFEELYPKYGEQEKIGTFFNNLDNVITLHQRKLNKLKEIKLAYLSEMFPKKGDKYPRRRFAGFTDPWEQRELGQYGYFYYGKSAPKWSVTKDATTPCVRYGELYSKYSEKIDRIYSYTNIPKENLKFSTGKEILIPRVGEDPLDFANCAWLSVPDVAIGEMISVYNTDQHPLFTAYMFNGKLKYEFAKRVEGGNVSNLYYTYLENIMISYPCIQEQEKIADFFNSLDKLITLHQRKIEKLKNLKKAYLNELFV